MSQKKQTTLYGFMKENKQPNNNNPNKKFVEDSTPILSDKDYDEDNQRVGKQLLYVMPYHIPKLWTPQQKLVMEVAGTKEIKPFLLYQIIEKIFATHFNSEIQINFKGLLDALKQMPETLKYSFLNGAVQNAAKLVLKSENHFQDFLQILIQQENMEVMLTYQQIAVLIANMFFCTFHLQPNYKYMPKKFLFSELFGGKEIQQEKIKFFINYFILIDKHGVGDGTIKFERRLSKRINIGDKKLCKVTPKKGCLEDEKDATIVDFANKYIGGGTLGNGSTQEEILFLCYPEMLPSIIITEMLEDNEVLFVSGVRRFNNYGGYSDKLKWKQLNKIEERRDIICLDAVDLRGNASQESHLMRELGKCITGFRNEKRISSGRWGCGIFQGDLIEKFLIQWISCSECGCNELIYYDQGKDYEKCLKWGKINTTNELFRKLENYEKRKRSGEQIESLVEYLIYY